MKSATMTSKTKKGSTLTEFVNNEDFQKGQVEFNARFNGEEACQGAHNEKTPYVVLSDKMGAAA